MSLVTACIRPSGASYRNDLIAHKRKHNPSPIIDDLLKDNLGYLVYQEDIIKFLQQVCGLPGSTADSVRRGIAKKNMDILEKYMPIILDGYCSHSDKPREQAEDEAKDFLKVIEDASSYMFNYSHSVAYCLMGYLCAYYRYYYPLEFITAFLNDAANDADIQNGTRLAKQKGIRITPPKFGISKGDYFFDKERNTIAKGLGSVKYLGQKVADELYETAHTYPHDTFTDILLSIDQYTSLDSRQLDILIKIDFFSDFGNQRELMRIRDFFDMFKAGSAKQLKRDRIDGTELEPIVRRHASWTTKSGAEAKSYTLTDPPAILREIEVLVLSAGIEDMPLLTKVRNFNDIMGYSGYVTGDEADRKKLYVRDVYPVRRKRDGVVFAYNVLTQSIGSGKESAMTVFKSRYEQEPIKKGDLIICKNWERDGKYFRLRDYEHIVA